MRQRTATILIVCGVIGAIAGLCRAEMQDAVEVAQMHAGVVPAAAWNPFGAVAMRLWSLQLQVPALLLHWGASERAVSALLSMAMGIVSFQALGVTVLACGASAPVACAAPAVIAAAGLTRGGVVYPVFLFGSVFTWGVIGLSTTLLAVALLSAGSLRLGALLLAVLPAVHASLGAATWIALALAAVMMPALRADLWSARRWFAAGVAVTALSLTAHWWRIPPADAADIAAGPSFAAAVLRSWDMHRQLRHVDLAHLIETIVPLLFAAAIIWRRWLPQRAMLLPIFVVITSLAGATLHAAQALPVKIPLWLEVMMPGRLLNFGLLTFAAFAIGLGARFLARRSLRAERAAALAFAIVGAVFIVREIAGAPAYWADTMSVAANDAFYARVAAGRAGLLTASDLPDVQRRTRRPIVVNGAWIDALPYAPDAAASVNRALIALYGVDLRHPPDDSLLGLGSLPHDTARTLWESRSASEWQRLAQDWHIDQVITYDDWQLSLPRVAEGHGLALFVIPPA